MSTIKALNAAIASNTDLLEEERKAMKKAAERKNTWDLNYAVLRSYVRNNGYGHCLVIDCRLGVRRLQTYSSHNNCLVLFLCCNFYIVATAVYPRHSTHKCTRDSDNGCRTTAVHTETSSCAEKVSLAFSFASLRAFLLFVVTHSKLNHIRPRTWQYCPNRSGPH